MVLAQPLRDIAGRTLLKEGAVLSDKYIERIRGWGFDDIVVEGGDDGALDLPPVVGYRVEGRTWPEVSAEIEKRFSHSSDNRVVMKIKKAVLSRARELADIYAGQ